MKITTAKKSLAKLPLNGHIVSAKPKAAKKAVKSAVAKNGHKPVRKQKEPTPEEVFLKAWHLIYDNYHKDKRLD